MGNINVSWDNSLVNASANATGQRVSKRIKALGGAFDTLNFTPTNDMAKSVNSAVSLVTDNRAYEYKVEALCAVGGPTANNNGLQEGIVFACINPSFVTTSNSIQVSVDLTNRDITKVRIVLKKQSDDTTVATQSPNKVSNSAVATFNALSSSTAYYVTIELYATINGVEVISSSIAYLNAVCGGNVANYQASTIAPPTCPMPLDLYVGEE